MSKHSILGVKVDATDYASVVQQVAMAASRGSRLTVSALAVHGVMTGVNDQRHRARLNRLDIVTPDGQPVRWALWLLHGVRLRDRVYGPTLTLQVCERAAREQLPVFFYGSRREVLDRLVSNLRERYPGLPVAGSEPSRFARIAEDEKHEIVARIKSTGAKIVFVGLGCPRQEVFAYEFGDALQMPVLAVGAAFDYHAGLLPEPPEWMQRVGLQWLFRLGQEPRRLWRRYLVTNTQYVVMLLAQVLRLWRPNDVPSDIEIDHVGYA